jgi:hypothetical protein
MQLDTQIQHLLNSFPVPRYPNPVTSLFQRSLRHPLTKQESQAVIRYLKSLSPQAVTTLYRHYEDKMSSRLDEYAIVIDRVRGPQTRIVMVEASSFQVIVEDYDKKNVDIKVTPSHGSKTTAVQVEIDLKSVQACSAVIGFKTPTGTMFCVIRTKREKKWVMVDDTIRTPRRIPQPLQQLRRLLMYVGQGQPLDVQKNGHEWQIQTLVYHLQNGTHCGTPSMDTIAGALKFLLPEYIKLDEEDPVFNWWIEFLVEYTQDPARSVQAFIPYLVKGSYEEIKQNVNQLQDLIHKKL